MFSYGSVSTVLGVHPGQICRGKSPPKIAGLTRSDGVAPREEGCPTRGAHGGRGEVVGEQDALAGQPVDIRGAAEKKPEKWGVGVIIGPG